MKQQIAAGRQFEVTVEHMTFVLALPHDQDWAVSTSGAEEDATNVRVAKFQRSMVDKALKGWRGVKACDIWLEAGESEVAYSDDARTLLLDHRLDISAELFIAALAKRKERIDARDAARKN